MKATGYLLRHARELDPGCFAMVMATGIVSIDMHQHGMAALARALFALNVLAFVVLLGLSVLRACRFRRELATDFLDPARGSGFLTLAAASCVLGSQCLTVVTLPLTARALALFGALCWVVLTYLFLAATITARIKPRFTRSINGGWLVAVVATQALAVLLVLLLAQAPTASAAWLFVALCLYLLGDALYLLIITLVVYRIVFFPLRAREFTPPYWINMGALAITTMGGSLLVVHVPATGTLAALMPFVKGFTLFFWATATWWIPLLVMLEVWRYGWRHVPLRYEVDAWDIVFPLGMYTVGTFELANALQLDFLRPIPAVGVFVSSLMWLIVGIGAAAHLLRPHRADSAAGHLQSSG
jgi:tellurite resistance protein TehA-like permease